MKTSFAALRLSGHTATLLSLLLGTSGCAKVYHEVHYSALGRHLSEVHRTYYQSPDTGRVIAKDPCACYGEPPCFGYEPTCWRPWPVECENCPAPEYATIVSDVPSPHGVWSGSAAESYQHASPTPAAAPAEPADSSTPGTPEVPPPPPGAQFPSDEPPASPPDEPAPQTPGAPGVEFPSPTGSPNGPRAERWRMRTEFDPTAPRNELRIDRARGPSGPIEADAVEPVDKSPLTPGKGPQLQPPRSSRRLLDGRMADNGLPRATEIKQSADAFVDEPGEAVDARQTQLSRPSAGFEPLDPPPAAPADLPAVTRSMAQTDLDPASTVELPMVDEWLGDLVETSDPATMQAAETVATRPSDARGAAAVDHVARVDAAVPSAAQRLRNVLSQLRETSGLTPQAPGTPPSATDPDLAGEQLPRTAPPIAKVVRVETPQRTQAMQISQRGSASIRFLNDDAPAAAAKSAKPAEPAAVAAPAPPAPSGDQQLQSDAPPALRFR